MIKLENTRSIFLTFLLSILTMIVTFFAIIPQFRDWIRTKQLSSSRTILSKAEADVSGHGDRFVFLKIQTADSLSVEVYSLFEGKEPEFQTRVVLDEKRDAFFNFRGQSVNLFITDVDDDGLLDIVVPAYDENLIARLNVFRFNSETKSFERLLENNSSLNYLEKTK